MKLCLIVLFAVSVAFVYGATIQEWYDYCAKLNGLSLAAAKASLAKSNSDGKLSCTLDCVLKSAHFIKEDGSPNKTGIDEFAARIPEKIKSMKNTIYACSSSMKAGKGKCVSAGMFGRCMIEKMYNGQM